MRRLSFLLLVVVLPFCLAACRSSHAPIAEPPDEFEGIITYTTHLTAKSTQIDEAHLNALYGDTLRWFYRQGAYRWRYNGDGVQEVVYPARADTQYTRNAGIDSLFALEVTQEARTLDSLYVTGETRTLLGQTCHVVVKQMGRTRHTYCVAEALHLDPAHFEHYQHAYTGQMYALMPGAFLSYRYESPVFVIEQEAIDITPQFLPDAAFAVPDLPRVRR